MMHGVAAIFIMAGAILADAACPDIITRQQWGARPPKGAVSKLVKNPAPFVVIHHAASAPCTNRAICHARIRSFQDYHIDKKDWNDIGYNFLVGEDGNVYEGRGWGNQGAHASSYNSKSVGICFIGNFANRAPAQAAINAVTNLIDCGVSLGKIKDSYDLLGHKQVTSTECPGKELFKLIKTWPHWKENPSR